MKQFIFILTLLSVILTSCEGLPNGGMDINEVSGQKVQMFVLATRGIINETNRIGIFMYNGDKQLYPLTQFELDEKLEEKDSYSRYTLKPTNSETAFKYPPTGDIATFYAFYPYGISLSGDTHPEFNISNWNNQVSDPYNYDWYVAKGTGSNTSTQVTLDFYHPFSCVEFNITTDENSMVTNEDLEGMTLSISNLNYPMRFDIFTWEKIFNENVESNTTTLNMIISNTENGKFAHAIIPPETEGGHHPQDRNLKLSLKNGRTYEYKLDNNIYFEANQKHVWNIIVNDNSIKIIAILEEDIPYGGEF